MTYRLRVRRVRARPRWLPLLRPRWSGCACAEGRPRTSYAADKGSREGDTSLLMAMNTWLFIVWLILIITSLFKISKNFLFFHLNSLKTTNGQRNTCQTPARQIIKFLTYHSQNRKLTTNPHNLIFVPHLLHWTTLMNKHASLIRRLSTNNTISSN